MKYITRTIPTTKVKVAEVTFENGNVEVTEVHDLIFAGESANDNVVLKKAKKMFGERSFVIQSKFTDIKAYKMDVNTFIENAEVITVLGEDK